MKHFKYFGMMALVAAVVAGSATGANLLTNPGFESGLTGWSSSATGVTLSLNNSGYVPAPGSHGGTGWVSHSNGGGSSVTRFYYQNVTVTAGQPYVVGGYMGGDGTASGRLYWTDGSYNGTTPTPTLLNTILSQNETATWWHGYSVVTPTGTTLGFVIQGTAGPGGVHFDDMYVRPLSDFATHQTGPATIIDNMNGTYKSGLPTGSREDQLWSYWREGWDAPGTVYSPTEGTSGGPGPDPSGSYIRENGSNGALNNVGGAYRDFICLYAASNWNASVYMNANGNAPTGSNYWWEWHATANTENNIGGGANQLGGNGNGIGKHDGFGANIGAGWQLASTSANIGGGNQSGTLTVGANGYIRVWSKIGLQASRANPFWADYVTVSSVTPVDDWMVY